MTDRRILLRDFGRIALVGASISAIPLAGCVTAPPETARVSTQRVYQPEAARPRARAVQAMNRPRPEVPRRAPAQRNVYGN